MRSVSRRITDAKMLKLIKLWLQTPVEERDERGRKRLTGGKKNRRGTPQGGVISPLLANIYIRRFLKCWEQREFPRKLRAQIVNYADDFVILCHGTAKQAHGAAAQIIEQLKLTLNSEKTRRVNAWREPFNFLGYTFGVCYAVGSGRPYLGAKPSSVALRRFYGEIRRVLHRGNMGARAEVINHLNRMLQGWSKYFSYGTTSQAHRTVDHQVQTRLRQWLCRRHKVRGRGTRQFPDRKLYGTYGLLCLVKLLAARRAKA